MAIPISGKIYTFCSVLAPSKQLNLYYKNGVGNGQNVCLWNTDGSTEQQWKYSDNKLINMRNTGYVLDKYTAAGSRANNNADVWKPTDAANQLLEFVEVGVSVVNIRLKKSGLYLTVVSNANGTANGKTATSGGNVCWAAASNAANQQWTFAEVSAEHGVTLDVPLYRQANYGHLTSPSTLMTNEGCAVCCAAMIAAYKENNSGIDPGTMRSRGVFTVSSVYCNWSKASKSFSWGNQENAGNLTALYAEIKHQIDTWKDPVLIRLQGKNWPHFVVAYGYTQGCTDASQVLVRDPYAACATLQDCFQTWPTYRYMRRLR